jgi:hypothetical protein
MTHHWQLQDAKARFSELVKMAKSDGPQIITYHGVDAAVILSIEDFRQLEGNGPDLKEFLLSGPKLSDADIDRITERSRDMGRDNEF